VDLLNKNDEHPRALGYDTYRYEYYREKKNGPLKRIQYHNVGIKFIVSTKGVGKKFDSNALVLQVSLGTALLKIAVIIVDFMMLYIFPRRHIYYKEKF